MLKIRICQREYAHFPYDLVYLLDKNEAKLAPKIFPWSIGFKFQGTIKKQLLTFLALCSTGRKKQIKRIVEQIENGELNPTLMLIPINMKRHLKKNILQRRVKGPTRVVSARNPLHDMEWVEVPGPEGTVYHTPQYLGQRPRQSRSTEQWDFNFRDSDAAVLHTPNGVIKPPCAACSLFMAKMSRSSICTFGSSHCFTALCIGVEEVPQREELPLAAGEG